MWFPASSASGTGKRVAMELTLRRAAGRRERDEGPAREKQDLQRVPATACSSPDVAVDLEGVLMMAGSFSSGARLSM